jgi:AcrR family transcriptional regulator
MTWKRARSEEQKEQRLSEIVDATARLYQKYRFEDITFTRIAEEAGFTRSNLYKYFSSKEEIFLAFLQQDIKAWRSDLLRTYEKRKIQSIKTFASVWVDILSRHQRLLDLISILPSFLEKNVTEEVLVDFKRSVNDELSVLSGLLCKTFPCLTSEKAAEFLDLQLASAIGLYQLTNLSELQRRVLEYPEFQHMKVDFKPYFQKSVECLLHGLTSSSLPS